MGVLVHLHSVEQRRESDPAHHDSFYRDAPYWPPPKPHIPVERKRSPRPMWGIIGFIGVIIVVAGLYAFNRSNNTTVASTTAIHAGASAPEAMGSQN